MAPEPARDYTNPMSSSLDDLTRTTPDALTWLADLLLEMAGERSLERVLNKAVEAAAGVPGVALARVYLLGPGDLCATCPSQELCPDRRQCLHDEATQGYPLRPGEEPFSRHLLRTTQEEPQREDSPGDTYFNHSMRRAGQALMCQLSSQHGFMPRA
ncbi:MAG: hypothetical protein ACRC33_18920 [Gemmataceae bacterium]